MTHGILLFANKSNGLDYYKLAEICAKQVKRHTDLPITLVSDDKYEGKFIDNNLVVDANTQVNYRISNGKRIIWNNFGRSRAYDLSPYDSTLVIDTDYYVQNNMLFQNFASDFLIAKDTIDINPKRSTEARIAKRGIDMCWATIMFFKKTPFAKNVFDLAQHIEKNWNYFRILYDIPVAKFRNDYAFSIALHIANGYNTDIRKYTLPYTLCNSWEEDNILSVTDDKVNLFSKGVFVQVKQNIHLMNKQDLLEKYCV